MRFLGRRNLLDRARRWFPKVTVLRPHHPNANADLYGTKVLEIETTEVEEVRKGMTNEGRKLSETCKWLAENRRAKIRS